jgi:hypothetical protein
MWGPTASASASISSALPTSAATDRLVRLRTISSSSALDTGLTACAARAS